MKLLAEWIDQHTPEAYPMLKAEADCPCGIPERHRHCSHCGKLITRGDWEAKRGKIYTIKLYAKNL
jgi:hypothetical protein